jgi:uncharacterized protein YecA (UPF0149 family)
MLLAAIRQLQHRADRGATAEELLKEIAKNAVLAPLEQQAPREKGRLVDWLNLLAVMVGVLLTECHNAPSQTTNIFVDAPLAQSISAASKKADDLKPSSSEHKGRPAAGSAKPPPGRNEPCPCGSGKKYKHCCGQVK